MYSDKTDLFYVFCTLCLLTTVLGAARIAADDGVVPTAQSTKFLPYTPESDSYNYQPSPYEDCCRRQQESQNNQWIGSGLNGYPAAQSPYQVQSQEYPISGGLGLGFGGALGGGIGGGLGGLNYNGYSAISPSGMGAGANFAIGNGGVPNVAPMYGANGPIYGGSDMVYANPMLAQSQYYPSSQAVGSPEYYPSYLDNSLNFRKFHNKKFSKVQNEENNGVAGNFHLKQLGGMPLSRKTVYYGERVPSSQYVWKNPLIPDTTGDSAKILEGK